jgi:hypothetical protein
MRLRKARTLQSILRKYDKDELIGQIKDDGFKIFAVKSKAGKVTLYTRRGKSVTSQLPGIATSVSAQSPNGSSWIGELVYLINGKQSISAVGSIVNSTPERAVEQTNALGGQLELRVYEVLEYRGERVHGLPWEDRDVIVRGTFSTRGDVRAAKSYPWSKFKAALKEAKRQNAEGLVIKPKDSVYIFNRSGEEEPMGPWFKYKPLVKSKSADVVLRGYRKGKAKLIFRAYQYDGKDLVEVGQLSGLPKVEEKQVQKAIDKGREVLVEVSYQERLPSGKLRHMGWGRLRTDKPIKSAKITSNPMPIANPRTSTVKVALAKQAVNTPKFAEFADAYWNKCSRGIFWYPTNDPNFDISARQQSAAKNGKFAVFCNPILALSGTNKGKKYLAEINVSEVVRSKIVAVKGQYGAKIRLMDLQDAFVLRLLDAEKAQRSWKYQQGLLPSSKDQLRKFWVDARSQEKERKKKLARREERRAARRAKRDERRSKRRRNPMVRMLPEHFNNPIF